MSVWPNAAPTTLAGRDGDLVSVSIHAEPRSLELLLEALARVSFPINPEIYHDAALVYRFADGREETESTTLVEFPAYAGQLDEVRRCLQANGINPASLYVTGMWDAIHVDCAPEPPAPDAGYVARYRIKHRAVAAAR